MNIYVCVSKLLEVLSIFQDKNYILKHILLKKNWFYKNFIIIISRW